LNFANCFGGIYLQNICQHLQRLSVITPPQYPRTILKRGSHFYPQPDEQFIFFQLLLCTYRQLIFLLFTYLFFTTAILPSKPQVRFALIIFLSFVIQLVFLRVNKQCIRLRMQRMIVWQRFKKKDLNDKTNFSKHSIVKVEKRINSEGLRDGQ